MRRGEARRIEGLLLSISNRRWCQWKRCQPTRSGIGISGDDDGEGGADIETGPTRGSF